EAELQEVTERLVKPFDLTQAPLFRSAVIKTGEEKHLLYFDMHHIISDGVSLGILIEEFMKLYEGENLEPLRIQYKDYAVWQQQHMVSEAFERQEQYWLEALSGELPVLELPTDYPRPLVKSFRGSRIKYVFSEELARSIYQFSEDQSSTLFMTLLSAYYLLLGRYSGNDDIVVGTPVAGRSHPDLEPVVGMFVNTLAVRAKMHSGMTFAELLQHVKDITLHALEHQEYPFEELVEKLAVRRDTGRSPIFDTMFAVQNMELPAMATDQLVFSPVLYEGDTSKFDLTFEVFEDGQRIYLDIEYCNDLFKEETIARMLQHYERAIESVIASPGTILFEIDVIPADELAFIEEINQASGTAFPKQPVTRLFEEQVRLYPHHPALVFGELSWSYEELNGRANQLARKIQVRLQEHSDRQAIVALLIDRSPEMIVGILAVLKAGAAYVPIDPAYPKERITSILQESGASLTLSSSIDRIPDAYAHRAIDVTDPALYAGELTNLETCPATDDVAYVMFTSGTTGTPKGILTTHQNIVRVVKETNYIEITPSDILLQLSNYAFDGSTFDIFGALLNGAKLVLVPGAVLQDGNRLRQLIREERISVLFLTTALFNTFIDLEPSCFAGIRKVLFGGEKVSVKHVRKALDRLGPGKLVHVYGPTETTVFATYFPIDEVDEKAVTIPIGKPISNTTLYVVNEEYRMQPIGVWGELCIGGEGLSKGYLNRQDLTEERYITLPDGNGALLYKTGDMVRWLADGNIEYRDRMDQQVKLRGFRIELGEIDQVLLQDSSILEAAVIARKEQDNMILAAFVVVKKEWSLEATRRHMQNYLPDYMIPSVFVPVESLPITSNGKINRRSLESYPLGELMTARTYVEPSTSTEKLLASLWADVLHMDQAGAGDHFFENGGNSLKAMMLSGRIHQQFNIEVSLSDMFRYPVLSQMAEYIQSQEKTGFIQIPKAEEQEQYPVSPMQKRLYLLHQLEGTGISYNMPSVFKVTGDLDVERVQSALNELIGRHETLRTSFSMIGENIYQTIHPTVTVQPDYFDGEEKDLQQLVSSRIQPFNLSQAPLIRLSVIRLDRQSHVFVFDMHHIISDGISMEILMADFAACYRNELLPALPIQYKDYAVWQHDLLAETSNRSQEQFWLKCFSGELPILNLPTDFTRPVIRQFQGKRHRFEVPDHLTNRLRAISKSTGTTMYTVMLAAFNMMLAKYSGQSDITIGTPVSGRRYESLENLIGMFVNTLAMRNYPEEDKSILQFVEEVKQNTLNAFAHQDYPFEELVDRLRLPRDLGRNPLFDVMFSYHSEETSALCMDQLTVEAITPDTDTAKFDLTLDVTESREGLLAELEYDVHLFRADTIAGMAVHFVTLLEEMTANLHQTIGNLNMIPVQEREMMIRAFNDNQAEYEDSRMISELFEAQAAQTPDAIAVVCDEEVLTYRELNERANCLARVLREHGAESNRIVGLLLDRSAQLLVGILGVLKSGAAYLPIDPSFPRDRIQFMLDDAEVAIVLDDREHIKDYNFAGKVLGMNDSSLFLEEESSNLPPLGTAEDLAYVIYTSGSTGRPKGVMIDQKAVHNFMCGMGQHLPFEPESKILCLTTVSFDIFVLETLLPLCSGMTVVMARELERRETGLLLDLVDKHKVSMLQATPSSVEILMAHHQAADKLASVRQFIIGGEELTPKLLNQLRDRTNAEIFNVYGPTEFTVWCTIANVTREDSISIGTPIQNTSIFVVDQHHRIQPLGIPGELCISGDGMAAGYLGRPSLTAEKFVPIPFLPGRMMYKTGDMARWRPDGTLEYYGRMDHQVKIRGYRIELGEIEHLIHLEAGVKEAVVITRTDAQDQSYLCAYIVSDIEYTYAQWKSCLGERLPDYMIPNHFVYLDRMPLTPNQKIDRKVLPEPTVGLIRENEYEAPRNEIEELLCELWKQILGTEQVGINDNFFELGGHSLKAVALVGELMGQYAIEMPLRFVFQHPTVKELAMMLDRLRAGYEMGQPIALLKSSPDFGNVYFFPPLAGYGAVFKSLADPMEFCNFYAMDFIAEDDRVQQYVNIIKEKEAGKRPVVLGGYSVGGNLAFEVAQALEDSGYEVSDVIMIDSYLKDQSVGQSAEEALLEVREVLGDGGEYKHLLTNDRIREQVENTMLNYKLYFNELRNSGTIHANIHLIRSEEFISLPVSWGLASKGFCQEYQGSGSHDDMLLNPEDCLNTARIVQEILSVIQERHGGLVIKS
ncbi:amino acid adenylation domain-containing protein, partial [Paenibacillus lentus]|uniref:amino acid adenylation domain-containing protein n=1 Tax=Paenibacillus lentus TaxID=1338368 RepID=UPI00365F807C